MLKTSPYNPNTGSSRSGWKMKPDLEVESCRQVFGLSSASATTGLDQGPQSVPQAAWLQACNLVGTALAKPLLTLKLECTGHLMLNCSL